jgi:hypothetical protein
MKHSAVRLLFAATLLLLVGCASYPGETPGSNVSLGATLDGAHEVPPNASAAGGYLTAHYSTVTHILKWRLVVNALSTPITRAAFHEPDATGTERAIVSLNLPFDGTMHVGGATLTEQQAADLLAGRWSIDVQTEKFPAGEIRGQVSKTAR